MKKHWDTSARGMRPSDARAARRWAAERARIHEHNLAALREGRENAVVIVLPSSYREGCRNGAASSASQPRCAMRQ